MAVQEDIHNIGPYAALHRLEMKKRELACKPIEELSLIYRFQQGGACYHLPTITNSLLHARMGNKWLRRTCLHASVRGSLSGAVMVAHCS